MPAPSAESQHPEAWPASTFGHLREGKLVFPFEGHILSKFTSRVNMKKSIEKRSEFPMLQILPLFQGVYLKGFIE